MDQHDQFMKTAVELARNNVEAEGGQPFGAVLVEDGRVLATGVNRIRANQDPTAHAEMEAIRAACRTLKRTRLDGCVMYASGYPCPMCLSAMQQIGIQTIYYGYSDADCEPYGFSTELMYRGLRESVPGYSARLEYRRVRLEGTDAFDLWQAQQNSAGEEGG